MDIIIEIDGVRLVPYSVNLPPDNFIAAIQDQFLEKGQQIDAVRLRQINDLKVTLQETRDALREARKVPWWRRGKRT